MTYFRINLSELSDEISHGQYSQKREAETNQTKKITPSPPSKTIILNSTMAKSQSNLKSTFQDGFNTQNYDSHKVI